MKVRVDDRVEIKAGDEKGGWGIVQRIIGNEYHVSLYGHSSDCRVFERSEIRKRRVQK